MPLILLKDPYRWGKILYRLKEESGRVFRHKIFTAIERGADEVALQLGGERVLLRARDEWGCSPLVAAITKNRPLLVREFIRRGGMQVGDGSIAHAAMSGNIVAVQALLAANKAPDEPLPATDVHDKRYTPLMWAANRKFVPIVRALLEAGANVNAIAADASTAVMFTRTAEPADLVILDLLCSYKADVTIKDWRGRNLVHEARDRSLCSGMPEMQQILERYYPNINFESS